jgi:hypothetical protein
MMMSIHLVTPTATRNTTTATIAIITIYIITITIAIITITTVTVITTTTSELHQQLSCRECGIYGGGSIHPIGCNISVIAALAEDGM